MILRYDRRALSDLRSIDDFITRYDPVAADRVMRRLIASIRRLETLPFSGRESRVRGTRLLAVPGLPYIVAYRVDGDTVDIVSVIHTARHRRF